MKEKMPWLKTRLRDLGKTPTALAKSLGIAAPRVYEMIAGRRHIQPNEIEPMAKFLDWSVEEINRHLPAHSRAVLVQPKVYDMLLHDGQHLVMAMVKDAPKAVGCDEVKTVVFDIILERFAGRPIDWATIEKGLALAAFECRQAALSEAAA
jgi:hypothetical protein